MSWSLVDFAEVIAPKKGALASGPFGSSIGSRFFEEEGVPVIRGNNLSKGAEKFKDDGFVFLTEQKAAEFKNCIALEDDLIFTAAGSIGQVGIIPKERKFDYYIISNKQIRARLDRSKADPYFMYFWLSSKRMVDYIVSQNNGGAVPLLNLGLIRKLPVPLPPLKTQQRIASIISAYDNLIENNRRRIALLEEAAQLLYREWLVRFRFPGHEHVRIINGVPEGWEHIPASAAFDVNPKTPWNKEKEICMVPMSALSESGMSCDRSQFEERAEATGVRFKNGDTLFARITPCLENGKTGFVNFLRDGEVACGSTEFVVFRERIVSRYFVYLLAREDSFRENAIVSMVGSSGRQRVQSSCFDKYMCAVPPRQILSSFDQIVEPIFLQIKKLYEQNSQLSKARDLLLPRLMDGRLEI